MGSGGQQPHRSSVFGGIAGHRSGWSRCARSLGFQARARMRTAWGWLRRCGSAPGRRCSRPRGRRGGRRGEVDQGVAQLLVTRPAESRSPASSVVGRLREGHLDRTGRPGRVDHQKWRHTGPSGPNAGLLVRLQWRQQHDWVQRASFALWSTQQGMPCSPAALRGAARGRRSQRFGGAGSQPGCGGCPPTDHPIPGRTEVYARSSSHVRCTPTSQIAGSARPPTEREAELTETGVSVRPRPSRRAKRQRSGEGTAAAQRQRLRQAGHNRAGVRPRVQGRATRFGWRTPTPTGMPSGWTPTSRPAQGPQSVTVWKPPTG